MATAPVKPAGMLHCPYAFPPHATTVPSDFSARLWYSPAEIATTPVKFVGTLHWPL